MLKLLMNATIFTAVGIYLQQNYNMPDIGIWATAIYDAVREWENNHRR